MFGTYRTLLALLVVFQHIGGVFVIGAYAVFGFYILSGYLMTTIMHNSYGYSPKGMGRYFTNRFLRIYPVYWFSCAFTLCLIYWMGENYTRQYHNAIFFPHDLSSLFNNLLLFFPLRDVPRLTPPSWALTVELVFYIFIGLGASVSRFTTTAWFAVSVLYHIGINAFALDWDYRYFIVPAASLPFSTGAMIFHYKNEILRVLNFLEDPLTPVLLVCLIPVNFFLGFLLRFLTGVEFVLGPSFYCNYVLQSLVIVSLCQRRSLPSIGKKLDKFLGDFSYPVYLIHYQVGLLVLIGLNYIGLELRRPHPILALASLPVIFLISWILIVFMDRPINSVRNRVKSNAGIDESTSG